MNKDQVQGRATEVKGDIKQAAGKLVGNQKLPGEGLIDQAKGKTQAGFGDALGFISVVLGLGAMIGAYLEHSGGAVALADWLISKFGEERAPWAMMLAAFLVGLPIFFEVGFIILVPLVYSLTRKGKRSLLVYGLAMTAPLTILHSLVPPHPAPAPASQPMGHSTWPLIGASLGLEWRIGKSHARG